MIHMKFPCLIIFCNVDIFQACSINAANFGGVLEASDSKDIK